MGGLLLLEEGLIITPRSSLLCLQAEGPNKRWKIKKKKKGRERERERDRVSFEILRE